MQATFSLLLDQSCPFQIGEMLGDGLLRDGEGAGQLIDGGGTAGEAVNDSAAGRDSQGGEAGAQSIHNCMVVDCSDAVNAFLVPSARRAADPSSTRARNRLSLRLPESLGSEFYRQTRRNLRTTLG